MIYNQISIIDINYKTIANSTFCRAIENDFPIN